MARSRHEYVYLTESTGTCFTRATETAAPDALASRMRNYVLVYANPGVAAGVAPDLAGRMAQDRGFLEQVEAGWADLDQGRVSSMDAVKRRLGDL